MKLLLAKVWFVLLALGFIVAATYHPELWGALSLVLVAATTVWAIVTIVESY